MQGDKLKRLRKEKGYSLNELSKVTGISKSYLSLIERNIQRNPSLEIMGKLAKTLEVDVKEFVRGDDKTLNVKKHTIKSTLKVEIELSEDYLHPEKLKQIKEFIQSLNSKGKDFI